MLGDQHADGFFFVRMRLAKVVDEQILFIFTEARGKECIRCI
jgi:hypothetical protein